MDYVLFILLSLSVSGFAYELAYSDLSQWVKKMLGLTYPIKFTPLLYISTWRKVVGNFAYPLFPFIMVLRLWDFFSRLLACPYCSSVWLQFAINYWVMEIDILTSIILSPLALLGVALIDRLRQ